MKVPSCKVLILGDLSPWAKQFLSLLHNANLVEPIFENSVQRFCESKGSDYETHIAMIENSFESRQYISKIRNSSKAIYIIWFGRSFSKEEALFAVENRIYQVFENLRPDDRRILECFGRLSGITDRYEEFDQTVRSLKSIVLQAESEVPKALGQEIKVAVSKLERSGFRDEFRVLTAEVSSGTEVKLPFHRTQGFADALSTVQNLERTGVLWVRSSASSDEGKVEFLQGKIVAANTGDVHSLKAMYRMFLWDEPRFLFTRRDPEDFTFEEQLNLSLKYIVKEGEEWKSRYEKIRRELPPGDLKLELEPSAFHSGTKLPVQYFSTLANVVEYAEVSQILDFNPLPDVQIYETLIHLRKENKIRVVAEAA